MKWLHYILTCMLITLLCYSTVAAVPVIGNDSEIISNELWMSVFGPMAESGAILTSLTEAEIAGDDIDGLYLLYSLKLIRNSYEQKTKGYQYLEKLSWDDLTRVTADIPLMVQTYITATQDLAISDNLAPVKEKMAAVTESFNAENEAFTKMASYSKTGLTAQNAAVFEADYATLTEKDAAYEEAVSQALTALESAGLDPFFTKWSETIYQ